MMTQATAFEQFLKGVSARHRVPESGMAERDVFPSTQRTWIDVALDRTGEGRLAVNHHIMSVYAHPLRVYCLGTAARWLGEPEDVVAGFFADRLSRDGFLDDWQRSGLRLRRWLMNAFSFYLAEEQRRRRRDRRWAELQADPESGSDEPERLMDRAFGESIVVQAMQMAQCACAAQGLGSHWGIFVRHAYAGERYDAIAADMRLSPARAAVMARTAARHFRRAIRDLLQSDGATERDVDDEIRMLLEAIQP